MPPKRLVCKILFDFFSMVRLGPARVVAALAQASGGLTENQIVQVFDELNAHEQIDENLQGLIKLLRKIVSLVSLSSFSAIIWIRDFWG